jgi:prevent-host-death family protein
MATWGIAQAKAQLSELIHEAERTGPQMLSRSGRPVAVVVSLDEWKRVHQQPTLNPPPGVGSLAKILRESPLKGSGFKIPKFKSRQWEPFS